MKTKIKRFEKDIDLPAYQTEGAAGFDLSAREQVEILPGQVNYVFLNVAIEIPKGHFLLMAARSSLYKKGLSMRNGVGIIDSDYCGDEDQIRATLFNFTDIPVIVERGERIVQGVIIPFMRTEWHEVPLLKNKNRGGFGTTGKK